MRKRKASKACKACACPAVRSALLWQDPPRPWSRYKRKATRSLARSLTHALTRCQGRLGAEHEAARGSAWGLCGWPLTATCFSVAKIMLRLIARCPLARNRAHPPLPHRSRRQGFVETQKGGGFLVPPTHVGPKREGGSWSSGQGRRCRPQLPLVSTQAQQEWEEAWLRWSALVHACGQGTCCLHLSSHCVSGGAAGVGRGRGVA